MNHHCEPDHYPDALGETWDCPICRRHWEAFEVKPENVPLGGIPAPYGWLSKERPRGRSRVVGVEE